MRSADNAGLVMDVKGTIVGSAINHDIRNAPQNSHMVNSPFRLDGYASPIGRMFIVSPWKNGRGTKNSRTHHPRSSRRKKDVIRLYQ